MKYLNVVESLLALFITLAAGAIAGVEPSMAVSIVLVFYLSCELASDIISHVKDKKLPSIYEGIGDICVFAAIILTMFGLRNQKIAFTIAALALIIVNCVLIFVQGRADGKTSAEALEDVKEEIKD